EAALEGPENDARRKAVAAAIEGLANRPPSEASAALVALLALPADGARDFALEAMRRFPPKDLGPIVSMMEGSHSVRAMAVLREAGDPSVVPKVLEIFLRTASPQAGGVLERFGAGQD